MLSRRGPAVAVVFRRLARSLFAAVALASAGSAAQAQDDDDPRVRRSLNVGWRFAAVDIEGAERPAFDDRAWQAVDLPHTWNAQDALDEEAGYRRGVGWYRRPLPPLDALHGKRVFLHFEGANQVADVYVNGRHAGRHVGGYTAFTFDVTSLVRFNTPNLLAVRVDNAHDPEIPPLNADFTFYGGIYRDVWLVATDPVHIDLLDHASPGVYIDTPEVSADAGAVRVRGTVLNETDRRRSVEVVSRVHDAEGRKVAQLRSALSLPPRGRESFVQMSEAIERPALWSPETPHLYRVRTEVWNGGRLADRVDQPLGFRWFAIDPQRGFSLNGRPRILAGTNRHQDRAGYGSALPDSLHRQDVRLIKEAGFDFLRLAHYPQDPAVLAATDSIGLLVWEEVPVVNRITMSDAFRANAVRMLVEMIRQHYNHPSVIFWGLMNEVTLIRPKPLPDGYLDGVTELAERLDARAHAEDPGRATALAHSLHEVDGGGPQNVGDVLGLNLYFGWYYHDLETLGPYLDSLHAKHAGRPLLVSEYGAGSDERVHALEPRAFDFSVEHQQRYHESQLAAMRARPYLLGHAVWNQFDFGSAHRQDTKPGLNQKGLYFFDRTAKDVASYYRASLRDEPVLYIATREWTRRAGSRPEDAVQPVTVYTNLPEVELWHDGASLERRSVENATARWHVRLHDGANRLRVRATTGDDRLEDEVILHYEDRAPLLAAGTRDLRLAVNAGGHYSFVDAAGLVWEPDRPYESGHWGYIAAGTTAAAGSARRTHRAIRGTDEEPVFQATLEGDVTYRFDVADGRYEVRLLFAEIEHEQARVRIFDVLANDRPVLREMDLVASEGRFAAVERRLEVTATGGRGITLEFRAGAGSATVSGIEIRRLGE